MTMTSDRHVPTLAVAVSIVDAVGRSTSGFVFVPTASRFRATPPTIAEWIEDEAAFFAFRPFDEDRTVLRNKADVVVLSAEVDEDDSPGIRHAIAVECAASTLRGHVTVHTAAGDMRVLDELNRAERFLVVSDGRTRHLVRKSAIRYVREDFRSTERGTESSSRTRRGPSPR